MGLFLAIFLAGISGGICQLADGEVYPLSYWHGSTSRRPNHCAYRPNQIRKMCGWPSIREHECRELRCCWNRYSPIPCFRYSGATVSLGGGKPVPRPTFYPAVGNRPITSSEVPKSLPPRWSPQQSSSHNVRLSSLSSDISYNGCLLHCTSLPIDARRVCLINAGKDICLQVGCCYDERTNECFHSNGIKDPCPASDECQVTLSPVPICGDFSKEMCEAKGCCYNLISDVPTCYRKQAVGRGQSPTTMPPATTTLSFAAEFERFQNLFNQGQLQSALTPELVAAASAALTQSPATTAPPPTTSASRVTGTPSALDQLQQIQQLLEAGLLPTIIPANQTRATTTTAAPASTQPPKTAPLVQSWVPRPQYERRCDKNNVCRYVVKSCLPKKCGDPPYNPSTVKNSFDPRKIVGGSRAFPYSHPWTVMIQKAEGNRTFVCGGTLICDQWVVTAAHCLDKQDGVSNKPDLNPDVYKLFFGRWRGIRSYYGYQVQVLKGSRDIEAMIQHENFIPGKHRGVITHDIALIKLRRKVILNQYVHPICLPRKKAAPSQVMFATGWGISRANRHARGRCFKSRMINVRPLDPSKSQEFYCFLRSFGIGPDASTLKQLGVEIKTTASCRNRVPGFRNPVGILCAGGEPNQDTCTGDSGGPLVGHEMAPVGRYSNRGKPIYYFYGLTSIGSPSCNTRQYDRQPALYTDIHYYLPWIRKNSADCCS